MGWQEIVAIGITLICAVVVARSFWVMIAGKKPGGCGSCGTKKGNTIQIGTPPEVYPPKTD